MRTPVTSPYACPSTPICHGVLHAGIVPGVRVMVLATSQEAVQQVQAAKEQPRIAGFDHELRMAAARRGTGRAAGTPSPPAGVRVRRQGLAGRREAIGCNTQEPPLGGPASAGRSLPSLERSAGSLDATRARAQRFPSQHEPPLRVGMDSEPWHHLPGAWWALETRRLCTSTALPAGWVGGGMLSGNWVCAPTWRQPHPLITRHVSGLLQLP